MAPPLPRYLQKLVRKAEKEPDVFLREVRQECEKNGDITFSHPQVLRLFVEQLNTPVFDGPGIERNKALEGFIGINGAIPHLRDDEHAARVFNQAITQAWPKAWKWFRYFLSEMEMEPEKHDAWMKVQAMFVSVFGYLLLQTQTPTRIMIVKTEGVLGLAMELYLNLAKRPAILPAWTTYQDDASICNIMSSLLMNSYVDFEELRAKLPSNKKNASTLLFGPLHCAVFGGKDWNRLRVQVTQVLSCILLKSPAFFRRLSLKHNVIQFCELLSGMVNDLSQDKNPNPSPGLMEPIGTLLMFIRQYATEVPQDHSWIIIAGNHGLLSSALNAAALRQDYFSITSLGLLLEQFAVYSLYRPVLRRLRMVLEMEDEPWKAIKDGTFAISWQKFLKAVEYSQTAYNRDYLSSPRNRKFLEYLTDREMTAHSDLIITKRDQFLSKPNLKLPLVLRVDFTRNVPPVVDVHEKENFVKEWFDNRSTQRIPLLAPFIILKSGIKLRPISISNERSGHMFGWLDENAGCDDANAV
ncbi:hypothetical protein H0H93_011589 [Arthromyces matolae]|nr:hypothetical protein H0H93_011589 [Arthromyces matolae]